VSGTHNGLYILRGGLYIILNQSFIYFVAKCNIEGKYDKYTKANLKDMEANKPNANKDPKGNMDEV